MGHADAAVRARWLPVINWFRGASTNVAGGDALTQVTPIVDPRPARAQLLQAWAHRTKDAIMVRAGLGGPGLTTAAFNIGVAGIQNTLQNTATAALEFEHARSNRTFTQRHGDVLAERMHRLCGVLDDDHLPETYRLLARAAKGKDYAILSGQIAARVEASPVP